MSVLRIVKEYNNQSQLAGVVQTDCIPFASKEAALRWVKNVNQLNLQGRLDWDLIDYEFALIEDGCSEILENPTGGYTGALAKPDD